ncbi:hypothetical protein ACIBLA_19280 [Streptomyces sp. NPDC050433]|uniref:hypothetical protein n=1 Tax=Streptomyces sp. NPDC050433 TaxID=3365615 RepID=UPI0037BBCA77
MDDSARMWITTVPGLDPDGGPVVLLGHDHTSQETGRRMISQLLDRGHEDEEGVFYLLPFDLSARYERDGDRLAVVISTSGHPDTLLRRVIVTDFVPAERDGEKQPVLLIDDDGSASLPELLARFAEGEAGIAVLNAD